MQPRVNRGLREKRKVATWLKDSELKKLREVRKKGFTIPPRLNEQGATAGVKF